MKCTILESGKLAVESSDIPTATDGHCLFSVKASGICGSDLPRAYNNGAYHYPIVVGHEFSGVVLDSKNKNLIGKRAAVFPILPCGKCEFCKKQQWANCVNYDYYGSRRDGGMQSHLLIKETNLVPLPDNVSYEAAAMIEPTAVCLHAVKKAEISSDSTVLIYGAGTIGLLSAMWAKALGAKEVFIKDIDERRVKMAKNLGFSEYSGQTVSVVIEASGSFMALCDGILNCAPFGRIILVGHGKADTVINHDAFVAILRKQLSVYGSWNSDFSDSANDWQESVVAISEGRINPELLITHKVPLSEADNAFYIPLDKNELSNKVMVVM